MKYSQPTGIIAALALIGICYIPWTFITSQQIIITGLHAEGTSFGKPGMMNIFLSSLSIIFFVIPKIWAKRINVFIAAINFAWAIRNYLLLTTCQAGECPEKRTGIYLLLLSSFIIQLMTLFPKMKVSSEN